MKRKRRENDSSDRAERRNGTDSQKSVRRNSSVRTIKGQAHDEAEYRSGNSARTRKRRLSPWRVTIFIFILLVFVALVIGTFMIFNNPNALGTESPIAVFGVQQIQVDGVTKYDVERIKEKSGIILGQSVFSVEKKKAVSALLAEFPYFTEVSISNQSFNIIKIVVTEAQGVFVVQNGENDVILATNGKAVEILSADSPESGNYHRVKAKLSVAQGGKTTDNTQVTTTTKPSAEGTQTTGTATAGTTGGTTAAPDNSGNLPVISGEDLLGKIVLDERTIEVINFIASKKADTLTYIDTTNLASVSILWNNQIKIILGTDYQIDHKLDTAYTVLNKVLEEKGEQVRGTLTIITYSEKGSGKNQAVFTPEKIEGNVENPVPENIE